ncbi:hypothetical protein MTR67_011548 [Solanum verrucosum]|uniref:Uncharacterized protein n=1 Tax=Solanum verrucosum TaxID=315347 RepID=A0AAF0Q894_SOLVR|nr:hypothetical protein MTR67_011548 [Solanum verrucosum]
MMLNSYVSVVYGMSLMERSQLTHDFSSSTKDGVAARQYASDLSSSPPFFSGSPPCRVMNPLIHDAQFSNQKQHRLSSSPSPSTSPSSSCKGRCARARLGKPHSPNRVEGFDCLNSRMAAMA